MHDVHLDKHFPEFVLWDSSPRRCTWTQGFYVLIHLINGDLYYATVIPPQKVIMYHSLFKAVVSPTVKKSI